MGSLCFSLGTLGLITGCIMCTNAVFNFWVIFRNRDAVNREGGLYSEQATGEQVRVLIDQCIILMDVALPV